jgi:tyrosyl-tRNA synthetase
MSLEGLRELRKDVVSGDAHPKDVKIRLAQELVARFHGYPASEAAASEFENVFKNKGLPDEIETIEIKGSEGRALVEILFKAGLATSKSEVRRLIKQGGITVDDKKVNEIDYVVPEANHLIRVGKRRFLKVHII